MKYRYDESNNDCGLNVAVTPLYIHKLKAQISGGQGLRVITNTTVQMQTPMHVSVGINRHPPITWDVPQLIESDNSISTPEAERTICLLKNDTNPEFEISATSPAEPVQFSLKCRIVNDYFARLDQSYDVTVPNGSPQFYYIDLTDVTGYLNVTVKSDDAKLCGTVSIHPLICPISEYNITYQNIFQLGVLTINANDYIMKQNEPGFFLKLTAYASNCPCDPEGRQIYDSLSQGSFEHFLFLEFQKIWALIFTL